MVRAATGSMCSSTGDISSKFHGCGGRRREFLQAYCSICSATALADAAHPEMANGNSFRWLVLAVSLMLWSGCSLQPLQQQQSISGIGRIEYRRSQKDGVVVGVPHGLAEPAAVGYADGIAARTGAGVVIAYGFGSKRVPVSEPLVRRTGTALGRRGSIYPEFKSLLQRAANGPLRFYIGIRVAGTKREIERIEVAAAGCRLNNCER
jgi:hypothetical protein